MGLAKKKRRLLGIIIGLLLFIALYFIGVKYNISLCLFKNIFGISCPGCGMTRGFISILHLDFMSAFKYNPLSVILFFAIAVYAFLSVIDILLNKNYTDALEKVLSKWYMFIIYAILIILGSIIKYNLWK